MNRLTHYHLLLSIGTKVIGLIESEYKTLMSVKGRVSHMSNIKLLILVDATAEDHHSLSKESLRVSILELTELNHCAVTAVFQVELSIFSVPNNTNYPFALQASYD